ncbi:MAG: circadian clock protein KaiB [Desulfobacterales bacterium]|nr:circadian clock protein KaiB [Desulfobacterales bacterium]
MVSYKLKLYITGHTTASRRALENIRRICKEQLAGKYDLQVIDVLKEPQLAEADKIIATPTLVKKLPVPLRKIIGDLSNTDKVILGLDLIEPSTENNHL